MKMLEMKLQYAHQQVDDLIAEKAVTRSCIPDVSGLLSDIIETRDPMISITVKKHLADKLRPVFAMLHCLEGVSQIMFIPKQGGERSSKNQTNAPPPPSKLQLTLLSSNKNQRRKKNFLTEEPIIDDSEDKEPNESELKRRKAREAEIDDHARIVREVEEKEKADKEAQATLKSKMLLFPKLALKRMQKNVVDMPSQYWLDLIASFEIQTTKDSQLDLPITPKAFRFLAFIKIVNVPFSDNTADQMLFAFYLKHIKPQYETWSARKIMYVKITGPIEIKSFPNARFNVATGSASQACEFTLIDLPCLNPHGWMMIYNILVRNKEKYESVVSHLQLLIKSYIQEVGSMDVENTIVLRKQLRAVPKKAPKDFEKLKPGKNFKE
uniref:Uncharacterized protein n=1 Tax=Lactuca sativa TaxID=4236 RepID=A0A9R1WU82_LACSA|nr:hypothetical protein LSAT_V11C900486170 [Lactuca sativa]